MSHSVATASAGDPSPGSTATAFRAAVGLYAGAVLGGLATTSAATVVDARGSLVATAIAAFLAGAGVGVGLAGRADGLPSRLGRTWIRQLAVVCSALPFATAIVASLFGPLEPPIGFAALGSAFAVGISGLVLARAAENRYVDTATADAEPVASWRWHWSPSGSRTLDLFMILAWGLLAGSNALRGDWWAVVLWIGFAVGIAVVSVAEGRWVRWLPDAASEGAAIRVYEHGFATERPYRRQFVPWSAVSHVRLRGGELVVDRGLFDHRFARDELEDPDALLEAIDRQLAATDDR